MSVPAIVVAAGRGIRMNAAVRKQYLPVAGRPLIHHTLEVFNRCDAVDSIFLVVPEADFEYCRKQFLPCPDKDIRLVAGGEHRQDSVYNGLIAAGPENEIVVVHDGVRPCVDPDHIAACINGAREYGACIVGIPAYDTLKQVDHEAFIEETLQRDVIWLAQTPQAFRYEIILKAHQHARAQGYSGTDDSILVERLGVRVKIIEGSRYNIKVTTPEDLVFVKAFFEPRTKSVPGSGFNVPSS